MSSPLATVTSQALRLSEDERIALATTLLESVRAPEDTHADAELAAELYRRSAEADARETRGATWEEARARILAEFNLA